MRINLPSAILLSGTVMLLSSVGAFAQTKDTAMLGAGETAAAQTTESTGMQTTTTVGAASGDSSTSTNVKVEQTTKADKATAAVKSKDGSVNANGGKFNFNPEAQKDAIVDPADAIEKAGQLHAKAMEQGKAKDVPAAIITEQQAIDAAPHYWLPHAGMVYLLMGQKKRPMDAMKEASLSIYGKHGAVAERNAAKLFEMIHWYPPAQKALNSAITLEPDSWQARVGLCDLYLAEGNTGEAKKALDGIKPELISTFPALSSVATHFLSLEDYEKAKDLYEKAVALAPDDQAKKECADRLFIIGLKTNNDQMIKTMFPQISEDLKTARPELVLQARAKMATTPADLDVVLKEAANVQSHIPGEVFFTVGKEMYTRAATLKTQPDEVANRKAYLRQADQAFKNAISRDQAGITYRVFDLASLDQLGDLPAEQQAYTNFKESLPPDAANLKLGDIQPQEYTRKLNDYARYNLVNAFEIPRDTTEGAFKSHARELQFKVMKSSCSCHARGMRKALMQEAGVLFAATSKDDKPVLTVIYDGRFNNTKKLMATKGVESYHDPIELVSDKPMTNFVELSDAILQREDQKPAIALKHDYTLEMPMDNPGQVAQNSGKSNVH
jgi:tetratricopeptide (TPR) repeat protein